MGRVSWVLSVGLAVLIGTADAADAARVIDRLRFVGNDVTQESILRQELLLREGDVADPGRIEASRQALLNLGLFKEVEALLVDDPALGQVLEFRLTEKYYILPIPRIRRSADGDYGYGAELRFDNLFGLNQQLKLLHENEDDGNGVLRKTRVDWSVPRLIGSRFGLDLGLRHDSGRQDGGVGEVLPDAYDEKTLGLRMAMTRWLLHEGPSRGWRLRGGVEWMNREFTPLDPTTSTMTGKDLEWLFGVLYTDFDDLGATRDGVEYGGELRVGLRDVGADVDHRRLELFYRAWRPLGAGQNLDYQVSTGYVDRTAFGDAAFSLGGGNSLRGYSGGAFKGDGYALANVEYSVPLYGEQAFRAAGFVDVGQVFKPHTPDSSGLKFGTGVGLRINLRWFVRTELRFDLGWAPAEGQTRFYAATNSLF
ncbi:MAG: BamA/TamA family outer membrane protein [Ectothiorhodospiraceae bacterium]|nr:BamA/TamA family outer membrane protein [Ectothiorhodospiraceae bacterium]